MCDIGCGLCGVCVRGCEVCVREGVCCVRGCVVCERVCGVWYVCEVVWIWGDCGSLCEDVCVS